MLPFKPIKILFEIGSFKVYTWGLFFAIAGIVALIFFLGEAKRKRVPQDKVLFSIIIGLGGGILGMILFHSLFISKTGFNLLSFEGSGLASYGSILGILLGMAISSWLFKIKVGKLFDVIIPGALVGALIGRIGCHLAGDGCSIGRLMGKVMPWAISFNGLRHPSALYEVLLLIPVGIFIWKARLRRMPRGYLFVMGLSLYLLVRVIVNQFRQDVSTLYQVAPAYAILGLFVIFLFLDHYNTKKWAVLEK